jgi:hypothetical protein
VSDLTSVQPKVKIVKHVTLLVNLVQQAPTHLVLLVQIQPYIYKVDRVFLAALLLISLTPLIRLAICVQIIADNIALKLVKLALNILVEQLILS